MMKRIYLVICLIVCVSFTNKSFAQPAYNYCVITGYSFDSADSHPIQGINGIYRDNNGVYHTTFGDYPYWNQLSFSIDSNHQFTNWNYTYQNFGYSVGGFMTKDNPGGYPFYPGGTSGYTSNIYNNTYDTVTRVFSFHYGFSKTSNTSNEDSFTTQVYERYIPIPAVNSFSPLVGPAGTAVTIKGWGFLNAAYVAFNGVNSDFKIVSDSEIVATAPATAGTGLIVVGIIPDVYNDHNGTGYSGIPFYYQSSNQDLPAPRTVSGLYSQGDTTVCISWIKDTANWASYISTDSNGTHLEMQTLFQDEPGNLCGFQSLAADTAIERVNYWWTGFDHSYWWWSERDVYKQRIEYFTRNYRINFGDTVFPHPVGVRLFFTTAELNQFINRKAKRGESGGGINDFFITRYDGPNEDTDLYNNADDSTDYTMINPAFYYYGLNNEYCYFEFYTDRFSEFQIGTLAGGYLLPLKLISFFATEQNHTANISWQTTNEVNTSYFTVQRSVDGIHFSNIGKVSAAGTSGNHTYSYPDDLSGLTTKTVYYRLQITDKDGSRTGSKVVSLNLSADNVIVIVPNPAHSQITITGNITGKSNITITDMSGKTVLVKNDATSNEKINISFLAKGMYLVRISYSGGYTVKKLLVE